MTSRNVKAAPATLASQVSEVEASGPELDYQLASEQTLRGAILVSAAITKVSIIYGGLILSSSPRGRAVSFPVFDLSFILAAGNIARLGQNLSNRRGAIGRVA